MQERVQTIPFETKNKTPTAAYLEKLPDLITSHEADISKQEKRFASMPRETPQQIHNAYGLKDKIRKAKRKVEVLKSIDPKAMLTKDKAARKAYNTEINQKYYTSSKFLGETAAAAGSAGLRMGTRQMLGMIAAELWFELRSSLPRIVAELQLRSDFKLQTFLAQIKLTLHNIWKHLQARFNDFLTAFKDGGICRSLLQPDDHPHQHLRLDR